MDKRKLVDAFIAQLEAELQVSKEAARATYEAATHEESKPENEYDTFALEASYLAGAQAKRAGEIDEVLALFRNFEFKDLQSNPVVQATAVVEVESQGKHSHLFLMPKGGGETLQFEGKTIQIITPNSTLGGALLGLRVGEVAEIEVGGKVREYEILSLN